MTTERQREIASMGGKEAQKRGRVHRFTSEEARKYGCQGGAKILREKGSEYFRELGRKGGQQRGKNLAARAQDKEPETPQ